MPRGIWVLSKKRFPISSIHTIVFDFDGVFTDNYVYVDSKGNETVRCSRADSYGVNFLKIAKLKRQDPFDFFVLSTEANSVVANRCIKMGIDCHSGVGNKWEFLQEWLKSHRPGISSPELGVLYFGNDLNDLEVMTHVGASICPSDAHQAVRHMATFVLSPLGGQGFVREGIEFVLGFPHMTTGEIHEFISNR
jgi:3-deoxy-D-manno-octulosonate 8-phosphate phosphatase (KDO 8-P phosphatase)